jgi:uncharacterized protein (TIGR02186 family)
MRPLARLAASLAVAFVACLPVPLGADLVAALSNHLVAITTGFTGTDVLLFGTTDGKGDVAVVVRGPENAEVVRRKGRTLGVWVNEAEVVFASVPGFYALAGSRPFAEFLPEPLAERYQVGVDNVRLVPLRQSVSGSVEDFRQALIRNKARLRLYAKEAERVTFLGGRLFRTDMRIPANAPVGAYTVGVYQLVDGDVVSAEITPLIVSKVGFEARVYDFAHRFAAAYGLLAIAIAAVAGWCANAAFGKG